MEAFQETNMISTTCKLSQMTWKPIPIGEHTHISNYNYKAIPKGNLVIKGMLYISLIQFSHGKKLLSCDHMLGTPPML